ncbi:helix-turn-helix domain-containing protein [Lacticaseibacillus saniviri]
MNTTAVDIGARISRLRHAKGWTQLDLANRAGLDTSFVSRIERGERKNLKLDTLDKIVKALAVSYATLMDENADQFEGSLTVQKFIALKPEARDAISRLIELLSESKAQG